MRLRNPAALAAIVLSALLVALSAPQARAASEIHLFQEHGEDWPSVLMRFPLESVAAGSPGALDQFFTGDPPRFDQHAYFEGFDAFLSAVTGGFRFAGAGARLEPDLSAIELVDTRGASGPHPGLIANRALLEMCAGAPQAGALADIDAVLQVMLLDAAPDAVIEIHIPNGLGETAIVDHRGAAPATRIVTAPAVLRLDPAQGPASR